MNTINKAIAIAALISIIFGSAFAWYSLKGDVAWAMEKAEAAYQKADRSDTEHRIEKLSEWIRDTMSRWRYTYLNSHQEVRADTLRSEVIEVWMEIHDEDEFLMYADWVEQRKELNDSLKPKPEPEPEETD